MFGLLLFFIQGVPESAGILACSLALARVELRWRIILTASIFLTLIIYLIRNMPVTFGLHTVASILIGSIFIAKATKVPPSKSFMAVFTGFVMLAMIELPFNRLQSILLNTNLTEILPPLAIVKLAALPQGFIMIACALLITGYRKPAPGQWRI